MAAIDNMLVADPDEIKRDLSFMTAGWAGLSNRAMFEVRAFKEDCQPQTAKFAVDWIDDAVGWVTDLNRRGYNLYAVRNPIRDTFSGSAKDTDIIAACYLWADCDTEGATGNVHRFDGPKWTAAVVTGTLPSVRVHTYWRLEQPCTDLAEWRQMQMDIAAHFGSDKSVINPSRIMRIGGTISFPDRKKAAKGYVQECTQLRTEYAEPRPPVTMDQMRRVFAAARPQMEFTAIAAPQQSISAFQIDIAAVQQLDRERATIQALSGTEWHNAVIRLVASYVARGLSDSEIHALTQPLTLAGYTAEQTWREVQTAIDGARRKGFAPEPQYADPAALESNVQEMHIAADTAFDAPKRSLALEWFDDVEPALTDTYLVKGVLGQQTMSVVYGPSNSGKTFFALDMAFHIAIGAPWRGLRVAQAAVLYLAAEGGRGVANRIAALRCETGVLDVPMALRRAGLDLLHDQADLQHLVDLAREVMAKRPAAPLVIVIDTLSRIMAGGDENNAADMTALIRNMDAIRTATGAHIMLIHHTGKDAARGARGHSSLRAATDTEIEIAMDGTFRAAMVTKQRDYQGGEEWPFTLMRRPMGYQSAK